MSEQIAQISGETAALPETAPVTPTAVETPPETKPGGEPPEKVRTFTQAELDAAVAKRLAKERRRFEREYQGLMQPKETAEKPAKAEAPKPEHFQTYEQYLEAVAEHKAEAKAAEIFDKRSREQSQVRQTQEIAAAAEDVVEKGRAAYKDFDEVINAAFESGYIEPGSALHHALIQDDDGHKLAYHLAKHPEDALRLHKLTPQRQLIELGRLSARLEKPVSKAPAPVSPVTGTGSGVADGPNESQSMKDWIKARNAQLRGKR